MSKPVRRKKAKIPKIDWSKYPDEITEINNPNFCFGINKFVFKNGDHYEGEYCAHKSGLVWREGRGVHTTKDGHYYEGLWENDQLLNSEETIIKFPDGTEYKGPILEGKYSGHGAYIPIKDTFIYCKFEANIPKGEVHLIDPHKNAWRGNVTTGEEVLLLPENHFYTILPEERGRGTIVKKGEEPQKEEESLTQPEIKQSPSLESKKMKEIIFQKSTLTKNDFKSTLLDEKTIDDYKNETEKITYKKSRTILAKTSTNTSMLKKFWHPKYSDLCGEEIKVFYPTVDMEQMEKNKKQDENL